MKILNQQYQQQLKTILTQVTSAKLNIRDSKSYDIRKKFLQQLFESKQSTDFRLKQLNNRVVSVFENKLFKYNF